MKMRTSNSPKITTSERLKEIMEKRGLRQVDILRICEPYCSAYGVKLNRNDLSQYVSGKTKPGQDKLTILSLALRVDEAWLMGYDVSSDSKLKQPTITNDFVTFPVVGDIAAGYDQIAIEDWSGETVDIPTSYLHGRNPSEFFVLTVKGDSMYPLYLDDDKVLILKQSTVNRSGDVGAILYDGECATLKKLEYVNGEDWLRMVPINPNYQPIEIKDSDLERCKVMGIPKLLIRTM